METSPTWLLNTAKQLSFVQHTLISCHHCRDKPSNLPHHITKTVQQMIRDSRVLTSVSETNAQTESKV